jgi:DNA-binding response OmpR family regulator
VKRPLILIVDDDEEMCRALRAVLRGRAELVEAPDGETGVAFAAAERPDLVFLDMTMPGLDGLKTLRLIKERAPGASVVMLTSRSELALASEALAAGASAFMTKPFEPDAVRAEAERLLAPRAGARPWRVAD